MKNPRKKPSAPSKTAVVLHYYLSVVRRYPRYVIGVQLSMPIVQLVNNFLPSLVIAAVLNTLSTHKFAGQNVWEAFGGYIIAYLALSLAGIVMWRINDFFAWRQEFSAQQYIANDIFRHLLGRSADFHANNFGGSLVSQSTKLLSSFVRLADTTHYSVLPLVWGIVITSVILWSKAPYYVVGLIVVAVVYIFAAIKISRPVRERATAWASAESRQTGLLADAVTNVMTIKSYARSRYEHRRFQRATDDTRSHAAHYMHLHQVQMNVLGSLDRLLASLALVLVIYGAVSLNLNIGTAFLMISYSLMIAEWLFQFGNNTLRTYNRAVGDAYDMANILSKQPEIRDVAEPEKSRIARGKVTFDNVTFTHDGAAEPIFNRFKLQIKPGEKIGLVGHSGSGKTTFTRLLMRFSDIDNGAIRIDDQDINQISQDDLHSSIAYVPQEPMLFHRSIAENIGYGRERASRAEIEAVARMAHADEFISTLPDGYDTLVGERGVKLSGGQRQRVAIARAMLKNSPILLLDEATSALDSESEGLIQDALWKLMEGRTAIVIAHRLSTIQRMDRIIVMEHGRIVEQGSHRELIAKGGAYAKLWNRQSGNFLANEAADEPS